MDLQHLDLCIMLLLLQKPEEYALHWNFELLVFSEPQFILSKNTGPVPALGTGPVLVLYKAN